MAKGGKEEKRTGASETGNGRGPGRPRGPPLSKEEEDERKEKKNRKDQEDRAKKTFVLNMYESFCEQPEIIYKFKTFLEKHRKRIEKSLKFKLEEYKAICGEPEITKKLKAKYSKRIKKSSKNDGTSEFLDMVTFDYLCDLEMWIGYLAGIGIPSEPPIRGREEELAEAQRGKMPATADDYAAPHRPIGGSQPSVFMDTYVARCPSSHGLDQTPLQQPEMGSQSSPHNEELECKVYEAFCEMPGIVDMFKPFSEEYMRKIKEESLDLEGIEDQGLKEKLKKLDEDLMSKFIRKWQELLKNFFEEERTIEKFKAVCSKVKEEEERQCSEEMDKLFELWEDYGPILFSEEEHQLVGDLFPENRKILEGNLKAGPSNVDSNSEGEWQSSTTLMIGGVTNSSSAGGHGGIGPILGTPSEPAELKRKREEELHEARREKRPATVDNYTPPCPPICGSRPSGFMADAHHQTYPESATAHLFSTNKGMESGVAVHDKEASTSAWAAQWEKLRKFTNKPRTESNDFVKLQYEKLQVKDTERRKLGQEVLAAASIDANSKFKEMKREADNLKKQLEKLQEELSKLQGELAKRDEPSGTAPPGDHNVANMVANSPQLQTANTGSNNVEQEDNIANRENKAAEAEQLRNGR